MRSEALAPTTETISGVLDQGDGSHQDDLRASILSSDGTRTVVYYDEQEHGEIVREFYRMDVVAVVRRVHYRVQLARVKRSASSGGEAYAE